MNVVCIDGTIIECDKIKSENHGLTLMEKRQKHHETSGFVPYDRLMYVVPEGVTHRLEEIEDIGILSGRR